MYSKVRHTLILAEYENFGLEVGANQCCHLFQTNKPNKALKTSQNKPRVFKISHENKPYKNTLTD